MRRPTVRAIARTLQLGPAGVKRSRQCTLEKWRTWERELRQQETALHACLPAETELVVSGKNILVFKRILQSIGYRDTEAAEMLVAGAPVIGELGDSLEFPQWRTEPKTSLRDFLAGARAAQASARAGTVAGRGQKLDEAVYAETRREVEETNLLRSTNSRQSTARCGCPREDLVCASP